jgi:phosphoribosylformimino-5-aminoimidazole carboxamide ribotide isomerase
LKVIPVIDLLGGVVVHAKKGERASYQPIQSQLTQSSQALDIVAALLEVYPFEQLYIADLDAIQKVNTSEVLNYKVIASIKQRYPELDLWVDAGIRSAEELDAWHMSGVNIILGSENFKKINDFLSLKELLQENFILSLDYFSNGFIGPSELIESTEHWPENVIAMTLENVGANQGVNTELLQKIRHQSPLTNLFAAGGVRNIDDLKALQGLNIQGVLVATALHLQQITKIELDEVNRKSPKNRARSKLQTLKKLL